VREIDGPRPVHFCGQSAAHAARGWTSQRLVSGLTSGLLDSVILSMVTKSE